MSVYDKNKDTSLWIVSVPVFSSDAVQALSRKRYKFFIPREAGKILTPCEYFDNNDAFSISYHTS